MHWENFRTKIEANTLTHHSRSRHLFKPIRIQSDIMQPVLGAGKHTSEQITVYFALISDWSISYAFRRWMDWQNSARCSFRTNYNKKTIKWYSLENLLRLTAKGKLRSKFQYLLYDCCVIIEIFVSFHRFEEDMDDYSVIMVKALADRLAEVSSVKIVM